MGCKVTTSNSTNTKARSTVALTKDLLEVAQTNYDKKENLLMTKQSNLSQASIILQGLCCLHNKS